MVMAAAGMLPADQVFLEALRALTIENGALLIFDEVLTGYRIGRGGAQELFGIQPDLTILAKGLGAGYPVAALGLAPLPPLAWAVAACSSSACVVGVTALTRAISIMKR